MKSTWAILVAGGIGNRFGSDRPKQFAKLGDKRVIDYSLELFASLDFISGVVLVLPQDFLKEWEAELQRQGLTHMKLAAGGLSRQKSVQNGLALVDPDAEWILVHDVARPLVTESIIRRTLEGCRETGCAVTAIAVADTLKKADESRYVERTVSREGLYSIQTPQAFAKKILQQSLQWAEEKGLDATDEAGLVEQIGHKVRLVEGAAFNFKITKPQDLELAEAYLAKKAGASMMQDFRIGEGYDVHAFAEGRDLILGGVKIPYERGLAGHSDADALLHAIGDAMLGAIAAGDLGAHFPDSDPQWKGASSLKLLAHIATLVEKKSLEVANLDATIICQKPKLAPHIPAMRKNIAECLKISLEKVSVKATTEEGLGFTGSLQGLAAKAIVLLRSKA